MRDPFDLQRFLYAQAPVYDDVIRELARGRKRSHWMWFIFPQVEGLGMSPTSRRFAIRDLAEARAYLAHPILGARIRECTALVNAVDGRDARQIFGSPDDLKFRSSMTLFDAAGGEYPGFRFALEKYCGGRRDGRTLSLLERVAR